MRINKIVLLILIFVFSFFSAQIFGELYENLLGLNPGFSSFFIPDNIRDFFNGISRSFTFFLILLFTAFGGEKKYRWIMILLIPAVAFEVAFDLTHIYFPVAVGVVGWGLGMLILKFLQAKQNKG